MEKERTQDRSISIRKGVRHLLVVLLIFLGFFQMAGKLFNVGKLEQLGHWSLASPMPLVFTGGYLEHFSSEITIEASSFAGEHVKKVLGPGDFARIAGPFARRSPYAVGLAYAPDLPESITRSILVYGFCSGGPISSIFWNGWTKKVEVSIQARGGADRRKWQFRVNCSEPEPENEQ